MTEAIKNAVALIIFCAPIAAVLTWVAWSSGESMFFVLLFLGVLSAIWVLGYLSERTAARKQGVWMMKKECGVGSSNFFSPSAP